MQNKQQHSQVLLQKPIFVLTILGRIRVGDASVGKCECFTDRTREHHNLPDQVPRFLKVFDIFSQKILCKSCGLTLTVFERTLSFMDLRFHGLQLKKFVVSLAPERTVLTARTKKPVATLLRAILAEAMARAVKGARTRIRP